MLKIVVVSFTIVFGSLIGVLSTGQAEPEDIRQWIDTTTNRVNTYVLGEMGVWVAHNTAPIVSAGLTLVGCVVYTLLFRMRGSKRVVEQSSPAHSFTSNGMYSVDILALPENESDTVKKAKARQLKAQLSHDKCALEYIQQKKLRELEVIEQKKSIAESTLTEARKNLEECEKRYKKFSKEHEELKAETAKNAQELQAISEEITKINNQI